MESIPKRKGKARAPGRSASVKLPKVTNHDHDLELNEPTKKLKLAKGQSIRLNNKQKTAEMDEIDSAPTTLKTARALASIRDKVAKKPPKFGNDTTQTTMNGSVFNATADTNNNKSMNQSKRSVASAAKRRKITVTSSHDRDLGTLFTFGAGDCGQLGLGPEVKARHYPTLNDELRDKKIRQVAAGGMHTVVLDENGKVWTFGVNDDLALGRRTDEEEDGFEPGQVELNYKIVQVSAGDSHSVALTEEGDVYAWGTFKDMNGNFGLIPGNPDKCFPRPHLISEIIGAKIIKISSGDNHLAMLTEDGKVYTCGTGEQGQLGRVLERVTRSRSTIIERDFLLTPMEVKVSRKWFKDIWTGSFATYCNTDKDEVYAFGLNNYYQLGLQTQNVINTPERSVGFKRKLWKQIAAGQHHAVALDEEGKVYTLGRGTDGRLGLGEGSTDALSMPTLVPSLQGVKCCHVSAGLSTTYAITEGGEVYAWGCGVNRQLGTGSTDDSYEPNKLQHMVVDGRKVYLTGKVVYASGGGQHVAVVIAQEPNSSMMEH